MQHTLKEQFKVVHELYNNKTQPTPYQLEVLNTVGATLAGLAHIGEDLIANSATLLAAAKGVCQEFDDENNAQEAFKKLRQVIKSCETKKEPLSKPTGVSKLQIWNGRGHGKFLKGRIFVAARSMNQAADLISQASGCMYIKASEIKNFYNPGTWGNDFKKELKEVLEQGYPTVYASVDLLSKPKLVLQIKPRK